MVAVLHKQLVGSGHQAFEEYEASITLTAAEIMDLADNPIDIIPGIAGTVILPERFLAFLHAGVYYFQGTGVPYFFWRGGDNDQAGSFPTPLTGVLDRAYEAGLSLGGGVGYDNLSRVAGLPLALSNTEDYVPHAGSGTLDIVVRYRRVPIRYVAAVEFLTQPPDVVSDEPFGLSVRVLDNNGDPYTGPDVAVDLTIGAGFYLGGSSQALTDLETAIATFADLYVELDPDPGATTLTATAEDYFEGLGNVNVESDPFTVSAAP